MVYDLFFGLVYLLILISLKNYRLLSLSGPLAALGKACSKTAASSPLSDAALRFDHSAIPSEINTDKANSPQVTAS